MMILKKRISLSDHGEFPTTKLTSSEIDRIECRIKDIPSKKCDLIGAAPLHLIFRKDQNPIARPSNPHKNTHSTSQERMDVRGANEFADIECVNLDVRRHKTDS